MQHTRFISMRETCARTSMSRTWINELRAQGKFPQPVPIGFKRFAFVEAEVEAWLAERIAERTRKAGAQ